MFFIITTKVCTKCGKRKFLSSFRKAKRYKDGIKSHCKACEAVEMREWRLANPEKSKDNNRKANKKWLSEHLERSHEVSRKYREANKEKTRERNKKYRQEVSPEKTRENSKRWAKENRDKRLEYKQNRRARVLENGGEFTAQEWQRLKEKYNHTCLRCGRKEPDIKLTLDHVIPLSLGGSNTINNSQPLCGSCNSSKGTKSTDYRTW